MFKLVATCGILGLLVAALQARGEDDDVKMRLNKARTSYREGVTSFQKAVTDWFDKREEAARQAGNKKLVDQIKSERKEFNETGEVPKGLPLDIRQKLTMHRKEMEAALTAGIKDYTRTKKDDAATAIVHELEEFPEKA